jgi:hypothetical protein
MRPPGGRTEIAFLLAMTLPLGGGSLRESFILVASDVDCEVVVDFAKALDFVEGLACGAAPVLAISEGEDSNGEPLSMAPKPPSISVDF